MKSKKDKKFYGKGVLAAVLIIGLSIGFCGGYLAGRHGGAKHQSLAESESEWQESTTETLMESAAGQSMSDIPEDTQETEEGMTGNFAVDDEVVLTINQHIIFLAEVNARAYMARDQYVAQYGEEPWGQKLEDGSTVSEYAKNAMLEEMVRAVILADQAENYGVGPLTDEELARCASQADDYMAALGSDMAAQFGVEREAMLTIYKKEAMAMKVYNAVLEKLRADLDTDIPDSELEHMLMEQFENLYAQWRQECNIETTQMWQQIVIGAVG